LCFCESLGEIQKAVETLAHWLKFPQHFLFSQTLNHVPQNVIETKNVFYFLIDDFELKQ